MTKDEAIAQMFASRAKVLESESGIGLRDYLAAKVMQGFCANPAVFARDEMSGWSLVNTTECKLSGYAYYIADAMIAVRAKENNDADRP